MNADCYVVKELDAAGRFVTSMGFDDLSAALGRASADSERGATVYVMNGKICGVFRGGLALPMPAPAFGQMDFKL